MNNSSRTNVILIVLVIIIAGAAGYMLFAKPSAQPAVSEAQAPGSEAESAFLSLTAEIGSISFDTSVFADPRFAALRDIRTAVVPETAGRPDPFAPLQGLPAVKP